MMFEMYVLTIEKLGINGAVVLYYLDELEKLVLEKRSCFGEAVKSERWLALGHRIDETYAMVTGYLWGIYSAGLITDETRDDLIKELLENVTAT